MFMNDKPQWQQVLDMFNLNPDGLTTADFCSTVGLAAEYRRAISDLRRKGYRIDAEKIRQGSFLYKLTGLPSKFPMPD
jgi:hypothetical protein